MFPDSFQFSIHTKLQFSKAAIFFARALFFWFHKSFRFFVNFLDFPSLFRSGIMFQNTFGAHGNVECGLLTVISDDGKQAPVPLQSVNVVASVVHAVAQVELTQVFVNKEDHPIEAIYNFPMDAHSGSTHFWAEIDGRTIVVNMSIYKF